MYKIAFCFLILMLGCSVQKSKYTKQENEITLYPGYIAKSNGKILWFSDQPEFNTETQEWVGPSSVNITSCIADPWPYTTGSSQSLMKISN